MHMVGCPVLQARHVPQLARVATTTWSPGLTERTDGAHRLDDAGALVAEDRRRLPRDGAVEHRQVGVAHAGGHDLDLDLGGAGLGDLELVGDLGVVAGVDDPSHQAPFTMVACVAALVRARSSVFSTLPLALMGRASTTSTWRGTL